MTSADHFTRASASWRPATRHPFKSGDGFEVFESKWAGWKSALFVLLSCSALWFVVGLTARRVFG